MPLRGDPSSGCYWPLFGSNGPSSDTLRGRPRKCCHAERNPTHCHLYRGRRRPGAERRHPGRGHRCHQSGVGVLRHPRGVQRHPLSRALPGWWRVQAHPGAGAGHRPPGGHHPGHHQQGQPPALPRPDARRHRERSGPHGRDPGVLWPPGAGCPGVHRWGRLPHHRPCPGQEGPAGGGCPQDHRQRPRQDQHHLRFRHRRELRHRVPGPLAQHRREPPADHRGGGHGPLCGLDRPPRRHLRGLPRHPHPRDSLRPHQGGHQDPGAGQPGSPLQPGDRRRRRPPRRWPPCRPGSG